jgi:DNA-directed RNA polymerase subunit omega
LNAEFCKKALEKVGNPNILVNLVSRRVRQLCAGGGGLGRPLVAETATMGSADIALLELVENKMTWEPADESNLDPSGKKKKKP